MTPAKQSDSEVLHQIAGDLRDMKIRLLDEEIGRVPRLERKVANDNKRITSLERYRWWLAGALALAFVLIESGRTFH